MPDLGPVLLSLQLAAVTTLILFVLALPLAWWLVRRDPRGRGLIQSLVMLPLVLPPTVLGYYLLVAFSPAHPPGSLLARLFDQQLAFSFTGILIGTLAGMICGLLFFAIVRPAEQLLDADVSVF